MGDAVLIVLIVCITVVVLAAMAVLFGDKDKKKEGDEE